MQFVKKCAAAVGMLLRVLFEIFHQAGLWFVRAAARFARFVRADHRYVYLGTSVLFLLTLWLLTPYFGVRGEEAELCLLYDLPKTVLLALLVPGVLFLLVSLAALFAKITTGRAYRNHAFFKKPSIVRASRLASYYVWALFAVVLFDTAVLRFFSVLRAVSRLEKNPTDFFRAMLYMTMNSGAMLWQGIRATVLLALFGTIFGFLLALLLVFLRIQKVDRRDHDLVKFFKTIGLGFSKTYITVVRGTPMMVQSFIVYYVGLNIVKLLAPNATVSEQLSMWPVFIAGLVTVSLNSTAYLAEVLRGGVEAIDAGQTEAARSLGMSQWQAMRRVVFPQAVKNSVPAIGNEFIINVKDSSVLNVIGVVELMFSANSVCGIYYKYLPVYCAVALIYLFLTYFAAKLLNVVAATLGAPRSHGVPSSN